MTAKEFRIGNLVQEYDQIGSIRGLMKDRVFVSFNGGNLETDYGCIEPIPLTDDWLINFGFDKSMCDGTALFDLKKDNIPLFFNGDKNGYMEVVAEIQPQVRVRYVHQLQNLYFALTGTELTPSNPTK